MLNNEGNIKEIISVYNKKLGAVRLEKIIESKYDIHISQKNSLNPVQEWEGQNKNK